MAPEARDRPAGKSVAVITLIINLLTPTAAGQYAKECPLDVAKLFQILLASTMSPSYGIVSIVKKQSSLWGLQK